TGKDIDLNLDLNVRALQLHTMEGAMASAIKNASGAVNGNVSVRGSVNNPSVQGTFNFDKTSFALAPLGSQFFLDNQKLSVTQDGFVFDNFTSRDSANNSLSVNGRVLTNNFVNYEFNLKVAANNIEVKKEAVFNIIVDEANGDFVHAQGEALLTTGIDPSGKITLVGSYTLDKGAYQLSFNFLQRKFDIGKGSTITWTGEPTTAQLNVSAVYIANTSPIDLVQDQIAS